MKTATFDIETNGLLDTVTQVWCAVVKDHETGEKHVFAPKNIGDLRRCLESYNTLIGHNSIDFDFPVLRKIFGYEYRGTKIDTLLMSRTQRPNRLKPRGSRSGPHSVESWGIRLGHNKVEHEDWSQYSEEMLHRCSEDVDIQMEIYDALIKEGEGECWEACHKLNAKLFHYLQLQKEYGWYIDQRKMDKNLLVLNRWMERIDKSVKPYLPWIVEDDGPVNKPFKKNGQRSMMASKYYEEDCVIGPFTRISFRQLDLDKNKEIKEFLLDEGWEPDEWNRNNMGEITSPKLSITDSFNGLSSGIGKLVAKRVQCKQRRGTIQGLQALVREDGRISAAIGGIAATGRLRHKGIVNIPGSDAFFGDAMRSMFSSPPGKVLVGCDSKGNQIRQLAARMQDDDFTKAVLYGSSEDSTDVHSLNQQRAGLSSRRRAKNFFYGLIFGAGDAKTGKLVDGDAKAGKLLKAEYFRGMPKLKILIDNLTKEWRKTAKRYYNKKFQRMEYRDGYIKGLDGRPILISSEHTVLVYTLQSDEAIHMGAAYVLFNKRMEQLGFTFGKEYATVIWYHDEYQIECDEAIKDIVVKEASDAIFRSGIFYEIQCKHEGDSKIGNNWAETH